MQQELNALGKLTKQTEPEVDIMLELYRTTPATANCGQCGRAAISIMETADEFDDLDPRRCEGCNAVINRERLEVFPNVQTCTTCADNTAPAGTPVDYCIVCGDLMSVVTTSRHGITRYIGRYRGCGHEG